MSALWNETQQVLRREVGDAFFRDHFAGLASQPAPDGTLHLTAGDEMQALILEKNYRALIARCASAVQGSGVQVMIDWSPASRDGALEVRGPAIVPDPPRQMGLFDGDMSPCPAEPIAALDARVPARPAPRWQDRAVACGLQLDDSFDHFVVGTSNAFAYEAARAVADSPGRLHNPLFIYGGVGLGKTHLMNAVGVAFLKRRPEATVRYLSAETFTNELIQSFVNKDVDRFRQRNRQGVDLLLIDDIQFIASKERTQQEFFHTFNALHQYGRQIVLTSDRFPQEMPELEERLKSRLTMGLITDIQPPELETRIAILRSRARQHGFEVTDEVIDFIARHVRSNVRDLHGALHRVGTWSRLRGERMTIERARDQLAPMLREEPRTLTPEAILRCTAEIFGITPRDITGRRRTARVAVPRKVAMFLARKHTHISYPELGRFFGNRDHTTVLSACRSIDEKLASDSGLTQRIDAIERRLGLR
ncbi:MAG: chromosomal replication initiator protein DnaA [Deltaproteobacteria bacterium]|nr:MAG: chromosomal replication initiator protein DnaA [Deltaproteobacteria bacterium]